jgi:hypothetical protein
VITEGDEGASGVLVDGNEKRHQYLGLWPNVPDRARKDDLLFEKDDRDARLLFANVDCLSWMSVDRNEAWLFGGRGEREAKGGLRLGCRVPLYTYVSMSALASSSHALDRATEIRTPLASSHVCSRSLWSRPQLSRGAFSFSIDSDSFSGVSHHSAELYSVHVSDWRLCRRTPLPCFLFFNLDASVVQ